VPLFKTWNQKSKQLYRCSLKKIRVSHVYIQYLMVYTSSDSSPTLRGLMRVDVSGSEPWARVVGSWETVSFSNRSKRSKRSIGPKEETPRHCAQSGVFNLKRVVENFKLSVK
jgi:hypothetical protein